MVIGLVVINKIHSVGTEVTLGWNGLALPFIDASANGCDFHDVL
jgi:hypothetical protein